MAMMQFQIAPPVFRCDSCHCWWSAKRMHSYSDSKLLMDICKECANNDDNASVPAWLNWGHGMNDGYPVGNEGVDFWDAEAVEHLPGKHRADDA